eukprot:363446-Chlamydomonas_euryale.AAC.10
MTGGCSRAYKQLPKEEEEKKRNLGPSLPSCFYQSCRPYACLGCCACWRPCSCPCCRACCRFGWHR